MGPIEVHELTGEQKKGSVMHKLEIEQEANETGNSVGREANESRLKAISRKREKNTRE